MGPVVGTRKLLGVGLSDHALKIEFSVLLIAYCAALPKKSCWCLCFIRAQLNNLGSLSVERGLPLTTFSAILKFFTILSENGIDITDVSLPWLSILLNSLQSQHPGLIFPKLLFIHTEDMDCRGALCWKRDRP